MAEKAALATGPISSSSSSCLLSLAGWKLGVEGGGGQGVLVSVWEENRGCERHDILSWLLILQNLTP